MTLQGLSKYLDKYEAQDSNSSIQQFEILKGLPFYSGWDRGNIHDVIDGRSFNNVIGLPQKNDQTYPLFDYEQMLYDTYGFRIIDTYGLRRPLD